MSKEQLLDRLADLYADGYEEGFRDGQEDPPLTDEQREEVMASATRDMVEFVAAWLERYENRHAVVEQGVIERWREEMA